MNANAIIATEMPEELRIHALPRAFGQAFLVTEQTIYNRANELLPAYRGGYWDFLALSNGGFYMRPNMQEPVRVSVESNGYDGQMSRDAAGIVCCLFAYSYLSFGLNRPLRQRLAQHYHLLRDYMLEHPEAVTILSAID